MVFGFNKKKQQCSADDARFLLLLCLGREPHLKAECDIYADMSFFGALKRILASRSFGQTLVDPFVIGKSTMRLSLNNEQSGIIADGLKHQLGVSVNKKTSGHWPHCLVDAMESSRFQKAFLSAHSIDTFTFLKDHLKTHTASNDDPYVGAVHQATGKHVRGIAFCSNQSGPLTINFHVNGKPAGSTIANQVNREIGEHLSNDGLVAFESTLALPDNMPDSGEAVLHVFDSETGTLICPPKEILVKPQYGAALLARISHAVDALHNTHNTHDEVKAALEEISGRLPAIEQLSALSLEDYDLYTRIYTPGSPSANGDNLKIAALIEGDNETDVKLTVNSIRAQTHKNFEIVNKDPGSHVDYDLIINICAGDVLNRYAFAWFAATAKTNPDARIIRASYDTIDNSGKRSNPYFTWQFDPLILAQDTSYACAFAVRVTADELPRNDQSAHMLWQQVLDNHGESAFATISPVIWSLSKPNNASPKPLPIEKPDDTEKLAIIIPTKDALGLLKPCIESLRKTLSLPATTEIIIVDNNSEEIETKEWFKTITQEATPHSPAIRVIEDKQPFNWAAINNKAAQATDADYLLFLNNDTLAIEKGWDTALRALLITQGVGVVGAKLLYEDDTIQHAGVILDSSSLALHEGTGADASDAGYAKRHRLTRRCSAVTGAFLACRSETFNQLNGFDAENFAVTFNDIDFCLRMNAKGHHCIYSPLITFYHLESKSRGYDGITPDKAKRANEEHEKLRIKWQTSLPQDPWYPDAFETKGHRPFTVLRQPKQGV